MKQYDVTALGELLIDFTENGTSAQGNPLLEANPGGAPCNVLAMLEKLGKKTAFIGKVGKDMFGRQLRQAVESVGIDTRNLMEAIQKREVHYHFVEVMACPGGCVGGGGQPIHEGKELASDRGSNLYFLDKTAHLRFSHENPDIKHLYDEYFGSPGSHKAHQLLHVQK